MDKQFLDEDLRLELAESGVLTLNERVIGKTLKQSGYKVMQVTAKYVLMLKF